MTPNRKKLILLIVATALSAATIYTFVPSEQPPDYLSDIQSPSNDASHGQQDKNPETDNTPNHDANGVRKMIQVSASAGMQRIRLGNLAGIVETKFPAYHVASVMLLPKNQSEPLIRFTASDTQELADALDKSGAPLVIPGIQPPTASLYPPHTLNSAFWGLLQRSGSMFNIAVTLLFCLALVLQIRQYSTLGGKSSHPGTLYTPDAKKLTLENIAGHKAPKATAKKIIHRLNNPEAEKAMGGEPIGGLLLVGDPGNGKTILARAIAGEMNKAIILTSGSEFVDTFVGKGAANIRRLFAYARKHNAIIFIDEIDAVGRARAGANSATSNQETENTLNQLLVEMDGAASSPKSGKIFVMAATNRPDILDPALLRPGRFDTKLYLPSPSNAERTEFAAMELANTPHDPDLTPDIIAETTHGMSFADIKNIISQARTNALSNQEKTISRKNYAESRTTIVLGDVRPDVILPPAEFNTTLLHETGHLITALVLPHAKPVELATVIPREQMLGCILQRDTGDHYMITRAEVVARLAITLAGREAEQHFLGANQITTGAVGDFQQATTQAYDMITKYSMFGSNNSPAWHHSKIHLSDTTLTEIESQVKKLLEEASATAKEAITGNLALYEDLKKALGEQKIIYNDTITEILDRHKNTIVIPKTFLPIMQEAEKAGISS